MAQDEKQVQKRNRITYMVLSVVIAIAAWALVAFANNPDITVTFRDVEVVFRGVGELQEKGLAVVKKSEIPSLEVKVTGKRSDLIDAINKTVVEIDVSEITKSGEYNLKGSVILPSSGTKVEKVKFSEVPVTIDLFRSLEVPVQIMQAGNIEGKIVNSVPESETVIVQGAKSELEQISSAVVTVELSELSGSGKTNYRVQLIGNNGEYLSSLETVEPMLFEVDNIIYDYRELPVKPVLHETLKSLYEIDYNKTYVKPDKIGVGILPDTDIDELKVVIDEYTEEEQEYIISSENGIYIPGGSKTANIKLAFSDAQLTEHTASE